MTLKPGNRRFVMWMAHLALIVYIVQIVAIDHWHATDEVAAAHARHCHGTSASCADGAAMSPTLLASGLVPIPPEPRLYTVTPSIVSPADVYIDAPLEPPRAA